ncbi:MAG: hypothetical protein EZS28_026061 [Streblomastix strix]|uniref:Uncharacterized protein n=1 Tax=Streblomastix strix TaxID=222440 RepID=A0A5J4V7J2_9EUKA|nr:MAG: hypothetical protein EZS28_026061 [Streblomastix strix]
MLAWKMATDDSFMQGLIQQSIAIAPVQSIGQPYTFYANKTALRGKLCVVSENFGFMSLLTIENNVYSPQHDVFGFE